MKYYKTMGCSKKHLIMILLILYIKKTVSNAEGCINKENKMCQSRQGTLSLNINACNELFTVTSDNDIVNTCEYLSTCTTHPRDWKCSVAGHPIDCFHCLKRKNLNEFKIAHDTLKLMSDNSESDSAKDKNEHKLDIEANEVMVLLFGVAGSLLAMIILFRIKRGEVIKATIPCVVLLVVSLVSTINMIIDLMS